MKTFTEYYNKPAKKCEDIKLKFTIRSQNQKRKNLFFAPNFYVNSLLLAVSHIKHKITNNPPPPLPPSLLQFGEMAFA